ncbi:hypothetical protein MUK42_28629 [Musa troglodytarum]|uniref:Uncharacterized protein n=1 Tax=Musa troglodytarum TaxID=320322 RepID=A0A9E7GAS0_9LILI|nr:hypothetical protein MUK42_28629 [Musa troglodytarum]
MGSWNDALLLVVQATVIEGFVRDYLPRRRNSERPRLSSPFLGAKEALYPAPSLAFGHSMLCRDSGSRRVPTLLPVSRVEWTRTWTSR